MLKRATLWGLAIRLGQRLSGGMEGPLAASRLDREGDVLELMLRDEDRDLLGEAVEKRLRQLAQAMGMRHHLTP
jgi:exopolyphosphatase/guanosine-5'-triphosphate,3'-diphosphate pyrophosphatase